MTNLQPVNPSVLVAQCWRASWQVIVLSQKLDARLIKTKAFGAPLLSMRTVTRLSYVLVVGLHRNGITPLAAPA